MAQAQLRDGLTPPEVICHFASLGNYGKCPQNEERDLHRWLKDLHNLQLQIYYLRVRVNVCDRVADVCSHAKL